VAGAYRVLFIFLVGALYIIAHEFGHYAVATEYGLDPVFVYGNHGGSSMLGTALGVSYRATTAGQNFFVIFGATMLPLALAVLATGGAILKRSEDLSLIAEVLIVLIAINLVPIPGVAQLDANRVWNFLMG
jgi:uncharacterized MAPEG superfamily protein